ncbi:MAG TPA: hypothetical protein VMS09_19350 [Paenibacillus sp.]|uniref:hypothetical protein n=1 Tax=Paenibacillus sp. TaxID=58172 RepID=UPI0028D84C29|nr:hypothetical protein [Paenibacillus sp.]HUC94143.1 hypothetical protein [Paenibacillus sp.]
MKTYMKNGWRLTAKHFPVITILFLYQLLWGFFLYRTVESIVVPLLKRYPGALSSEGAVQLFLVEAQFRLAKTDLIVPYLWMLAGLLAARTAFTPLINAGLLYSLRHAAEGSGTPFWAGIRAAWRPVALLYAIELALTWAPLLYLVPLARRTLAASGSWQEVAASLVPYFAAWLLLCAAVRILSLGMQFGVVAGRGTLGSMTEAIRCFLPVAGVTAAMWGLAAAVGLASSAASLLWAGLFALILHQGHYFVRTWFKVWTCAVQFEAWRAKRV